ncbi:MAG TPA: type IV pilus biogenesis/stability protein PilW [Burkholderiales bacterium]|nr:type IV pilus biogenesis/stability protein PilW [Burkholderiales bacterium]
MSVRGYLCAALLALAAGCATPPQTSSYKTEASTMGEEPEARTRARIHTELASGYFELGNLGVALEEVNEAMRADPTYGPAYNVSALIHADLKEDRLAEQQFERALRLNPVDSDANNNYGSYLCQRKREEEGIRHFLAALRNPLYQTPERSYVNAGLCSRRRGDLAAAQEYFERALKVRPDQPQALYQLGDILYARGDYAQARSYISRASQVMPSPETLWLALRLERKLGDRNAEASYAAQLRRGYPQSREARALAAGQFE